MCGPFGCARGTMPSATSQLWLRQQPYGSTASKWPDLIVAALMAGLFLWSASQILYQSLAELRQPASAPAE
jgi:hypothetical protein